MAQDTGPASSTKATSSPASEAHLISTVWALVPTTYVFSKSYLQTAVILKEKGSPSWFLKILVYSYWRNFRKRQIEKQRNCIKKGGRKRNLFKKKYDFFPKRHFWKGLYVAFLRGVLAWSSLRRQNYCKGLSNQKDFKPLWFSFIFSLGPLVLLKLFPALSGSRDPLDWCGLVSS